MHAYLARNWWVLVVRGVAAALFGILTFVWPALSLTVLVILWGAYALVDGAFALVASFRRPRGEAFPTWMFVTGLAGVVAGVLTFVWPAITAYVLLIVIAAFAIVRGIVEIVAAIHLRKEIANEWLLVAAGIVSVAFGVIVFLFPLAGALAVTLWIGAVALVVGALEIALGIRLRRRSTGGDAGEAAGSTNGSAMRGRA